MIEARGKQTPSARRPAGAGRPVVHMIGNAHIDHAWLWQWPEAREEVYSTCRSALDRMNEFPDFVFSFSSGESFVRQALYGKRYFQEKFGVDVKVGYNVDSFGHAGTLPQILAKSGMTSY